MTELGLRNPNTTRKPVSLMVAAAVLSALFLFTLPAPPCASSFDRQPYDGSVTDSKRDCFLPAYLTTRRNAIVTYVRALQAPEGYFHAWLDAPPPFEPDGTSADYTVVMDAYYTLKYINQTASINWTTSEGFLTSIVSCGMLNMSKTTGVSVGTCWSAMTFYSDIGLEYLVNKDTNAIYVAGLQHPNGGFLFDESSSKPTLVATYFALDTLRLTGRLYLADIQKAKEFLSSCHNDSGWYSDTIGGAENVFVAPAGIMLADMLGVQSDADREKTAQYLLSQWNAAVGADKSEDLYITERIAWALALLDREDLIDRNKMFAWVLSLQKNTNGAIVGYPGADPSQERLVYAKYTAHILSLYNGTSLLDEDFSVMEEPKWEIPQWWLDYIKEWNNTSGSDHGFFFYLPDLSAIIRNLPIFLFAFALCLPAIWVLQRSKVEREKRRELKRARKRMRKAL